MKKSIPNEILLPEVARLIKEGHTVTITVRGNSMNPFLVDRRDRVTLGDFTTEQLQPGVAVLARDLTERIAYPVQDKSLFDFHGYFVLYSSEQGEQPAASRV